MDAHEILVENARDAINKVFGDTSVPKSTTIESMSDLADTAQTMADTMEEEERQED